MYRQCKKLIYFTVILCGLIFAGTALAGIPPWMQCVLSYDGYLQMSFTPDGSKTISVDTLIVVINSAPGTPMQVAIDVYDKYGEPLIEEAPLLDGGKPIRSIPPNGFAWITLGQLVNRTTIDPYGIEGLAEKFSYRIYTTRPLDLINPVVEVKQMIYSRPYTLNQGDPYHGPWEPTMFSNWTETSLGGKSGTGLIWP